MRCLYLVLTFLLLAICLTKAQEAPLNSVTAESRFYPFQDRQYILSVTRQNEKIAMQVYICNESDTLIIWQDSIHTQLPTVSIFFDDYNADERKDLLISAGTGARGSNAYYHLYLLDEKKKTFRKVKGFEELPNASYDKKQHIIISYAYAGQNYYSLYKLTNAGNLQQLGEAFVDDFDGDSEKLEQAIERQVKRAL